MSMHKLSCVSLTNLVGCCECRNRAWTCPVYIGTTPHSRSREMIVKGVYVLQTSSGAYAFLPRNSKRHGRRQRWGKEQYLTCVKASDRQGKREIRRFGRELYKPIDCSHFFLSFRQSKVTRVRYAFPQGTYKPTEEEKKQGNSG